MYRGLELTDILDIVLWGALYSGGAASKGHGVILYLLLFLRWISRIGRRSSVIMAATAILNIQPVCRGAMNVIPTRPPDTQELNWTPSAPQL